jgi:hypothetical protein
MNEVLKTTALFIDADNVRLTAIPQILEILMREWTPIKMRAYGTQIGPKQKILRDHGVLPVQVIPVLPGKNSVDLVLTIDALEELFCGSANSIAIASGDSDFTPLALKIREHGKPILIFGDSFTPPALRAAATSFHCIGLFQQEPGGQGLRTNSLESSVHGRSSLDKGELLRSRMVALVREIAETQGGVTIGKLGAIINVRDPIFSPKRYGATSPEARAIIETRPGEECQVDYGTGPMVRDPDSRKYRRTRLFVMTLGCSRKCVRLLAFRSSARVWAELHEKAFRRLGGSTLVVVLDTASAMRIARVVRRRSCCNC